LKALRASELVEAVPLPDGWTAGDLGDIGTFFGNPNERDGALWRNEGGEAWKVVVYVERVPGGDEA